MSDEKKPLTDDLNGLARLHRRLLAREPDYWEKLNAETEVLAIARAEAALLEEDRRKADEEDAPFFFLQSLADNESKAD